MSKRSRRSRNWQVLKTETGDRVVIGLDVHKKSIHAAIRVNGVEADTWVMPSAPKTVVAAFVGLRGTPHKIVYEAGPTGFRLARALREAQLCVDVIAPGKVPQPANRGNKSDRIDCRKLALYAEKDLLSAVAIPSEDEEASRQITRLREQVIKKIRRVKQQIKSLLLQHAIAEPPGLAQWSLAGVAALRKCRVREELRFVIDTLLGELETLTKALRRTEQRMRRMARQRRYRVGEELLRSHPGVGPITAMTFLTEVYRPERFDEKCELTSYCGLAPRVCQTGESRQEGPLIKGGRKGLRRLLVEAAWVWIARDPAAMACYRRLVFNTGKSQKAIIGMARRLAIHLWCMVTRGEVYCARTA